MENCGYDQRYIGAPNGQPLGPMGGQPQPQVIITQPVATYVVTSTEWSWCHLVTSVISCFLCPCFGMVALVMSLLSYTDHRIKNFVHFQNKKRCALGFGIAAIVIGSIFYLLLIISYTWVIALFVETSDPYYG